MNIRQGPVLISFFISLLVHLFLFGAFSLEIFWPKTVSAKRPIAVRIISIAQPPPEEPQSPNPESRNLSDANRKESGAGAPSETPKLRSEGEEGLASKQGSGVEDVPIQVAALPPSPPPSAPKVPLEPEPAPPLRVVEPPPASEPREEAPAASAVLEPDPPKRVEALPSAPAPQEEPRTPLPEPPVPEKVEAPPLPAPEKPEPDNIVVESVKPESPKRREEPPKPPAAPSEIEAVREAPAEKTVPAKKVEPEKVKREEIQPVPPKLPEPKEPIEVAALPPLQAKPPLPRAAPRPDRPVTADPLSMFRRNPEKRGVPDAPDLNLSDDEVARIARAAREREAEEGEAVSLETRDFRYVSYFAHIKRKIQGAWRWPREARNDEGKVQIRFVLNEDGSLLRVKLIHSSGYRILDDEALAAVTKAAPFNSFPPDFRRRILPIQASFLYERRRALFSR